MTLKNKDNDLAKFLYVTVYNMGKDPKSEHYFVAAG